MVTADYLSPSYLAQLFGLTPRWVHAIARKHGLGFKPLGGRDWVYTRADVERFAEIRATMRRNSNAGRRRGGRVTPRIEPTAESLRVRRHGEPVEFSAEYWK